VTNAGGETRLISALNPAWNLLSAVCRQPARTSSQSRPIAPSLGSHLELTWCATKPSAPSGTAPERATFAATDFPNPETIMTRVLRVPGQLLVLLSQHTTPAALMAISRRASSPRRSRPRHHLACPGRAGDGPAVSCCCMGSAIPATCGTPLRRDLARDHHRHCARPPRHGPLGASRHRLHQE